AHGLTIVWDYYGRLDIAEPTLRAGQCEGSDSMKAAAHDGARTRALLSRYRGAMTVAAFRSESELPPIPALPPDAAPQAIRAALIGEERTEFERDYRAALAEAARTLELPGVLPLLRTSRHAPSLPPPP